MTGVQESCRIYLIVPSRSDETLERRFARIIAGGSVSCAMLCCDAQGLIDRSLAARLIARARASDVAFLCQSDLEAAAELGADGVHIEGDAELYAAARRLLGSEAIVGADCGLSRHCAMELAELGADYVAFSEAAAKSLGGKRQEDLISWWAELFVVPCVAWDVANADTALGLARHGTDFVAVRHDLWSLVGAETDAFDALAEALANTRTAA